MIAVAYYIGLMVCAVLVTLSGFLTEEMEKRIEGPFGALVILYWLLGWYLFGWKVALANIVILIVIGNVLNPPTKRIVKRLYPQSSYRWAMSPEWRRRIGNVRMRLGLARGKRS
jgi:hypothetical protein